MLSRTITAFEPRLGEVRVAVEPHATREDVLRVLVSGLLWMEKRAEPLDSSPWNCATAREVPHVKPRDALLRVYQQELAQLRESTGRFAMKHPKVSQRLGLVDKAWDDPHTALLMESFAFLTARVQHGFQQQLPEISTALLGRHRPPPGGADALHGHRPPGAGAWRRSSRRPDAPSGHPAVHEGAHRARPAAGSGPATPPRCGPWR